MSAVLTFIPPSSSTKVASATTNATRPEEKETPIPLPSPSRTTRNADEVQVCNRNTHRFLLQEKKHKRPPSMLEAWKLTHLKKDGSFVEKTYAKEFMEVAEKLVNERAMSHPDMPKELIEDAVFEELMYDEESPNQCVVGYGHGVSRNQVFGLKADLRRYNIGDDCMDVEVKQKLFSLEKENKQLKDAYTNLQSNVCQMASALARNGIVLDDLTFSDEDGNDIDDYEVIDGFLTSKHGQNSGKTKL